MDITFTPYDDAIHPIYFYGKETEQDEFLLNYYYEVEDTIKDSLGEIKDDTMVGIINEVFVLTPFEYNKEVFEQLIARLSYVMIKYNYLYVSLSKQQIEYFNISIDEATDIISEYTNNTGIMFYIYDIMEESE